MKNLNSFLNEKLENNKLDLLAEFNRKHGSLVGFEVESIEGFSQESICSVVLAVPLGGLVPVSQLKIGNDFEFDESKTELRFIKVPVDENNFHLTIITMYFGTKVAGMFDGFNYRVVFDSPQEENGKVIVVRNLVRDRHESLLHENNVIPSEAFESNQDVKNWSNPNKSKILEYIQSL